MNNRDGHVVKRPKPQDRSRIPHHETMRTFIYDSLPILYRGTMESQLHRGVVFALYQFSLLLGIVLMPIALLLGQMGLSLPMDKVLLRLESASAGANPN